MGYKYGASYPLPHSELKLHNDQIKKLQRIDTVTMKVVYTLVFFVVVVFFGRNQKADAESDVPKDPKESKQEGCLVQKFYGIARTDEMLDMVKSIDKKLNTTLQLRDIQKEVLPLLRGIEDKLNTTESRVAAVAKSCKETLKDIEKGGDEAALKRIEDKLAALEMKGGPKHIYPNGSDEAALRRLKEKLANLDMQNDVPRHICPNGSDGEATLKRIEDKLAVLKAIQIKLVSLEEKVDGTNFTNGNSGKPSLTWKKHPLFVESMSVPCSKTVMGRLRFKAVEKVLEICDGAQWLPVNNLKPRIGVPQNPKTRGSSCKDILQKNKGKPLQDGIYWINYGASAASPAFPVYCNMTAGGFTMIFKLVGGVPLVPADMWRTGFPMNEYTMAALNPTDKLASTGPYRNRIIHKWHLFNPTEAKVVLYELGKNVVEISFNATGSNNMDWFTMPRVTKSPWSDLAKLKKDYFSILGHTHHLRSFFINHYDGWRCWDTKGWMVATNSHGSCVWERRQKRATFLYSKIGKVTLWRMHDQVGAADVLAVFVR